ncbi:phytanoyl-CoA dioxygenase family protein [Parasphingopyxis algicola]|uniref:phytanoyl-CoA dioxygenase family protein n=1 Tax=Parasphingopyxis algicola TaxID=2026624 RepID=UPI0015A34850|nr:phytanoyl-CoA dioxygenase family protein [Parasphingopyxis algicola]QLC26351.1 phytanoyl-CoA dioxygenase family protein [Parasphingopyxis algicola]
MNRHPIEPITQAQVDEYRRFGVVCLRKVFDRDWVDSLLPVVKEMVASEGKTGLLPTAPLRHPARIYDAVREYAFNSPLAEACGQILQSNEIRYFFEEVFAKAPQSDEKTIWHADRAGWPVKGEMVPSVWTALSEVTHANSLQVLRGSHLHDVLYWLFSPNAKQMIQPSDRPNHPDGESLRDHPDAEYLTWEMDPGDMLVLHPWVLHYATGNPTDKWRYAISTRVFGDDITWAPRPDCLNIAGIGFDEMLEGEKPQGPLFPLIWSEDGRKEDTSKYPYGFATTWPEGAYERLAERAQINSKGFEEMLAKSGGPTSLTLPFGKSPPQ